MLTPEKLAACGSESGHQKALFQWINTQNEYPELRLCFSIPNGGLRDKVTAARMKAEGAKAGVWDIFLPVPRGKYHGLFIEMKVGKNTLTKKQEEFEKNLEEDYYFAVCYNWAQAAEVMKQYANIGAFNANNA